MPVTNTVKRIVEMDPYKDMNDAKTKKKKRKNVTGVGLEPHHCLAVERTTFKPLCHNIIVFMPLTGFLAHSSPSSSSSSSFSSSNGNLR